MNIETAKQINLADYLHSLGYSPVKQQGINLWYKSPLREETEASFKVNTERNQWYDFGLGKGGGIIELAAHLYATDHVPYLLERIAEQTPHVHPVSFSFGKQDSFGPSFQQLEIVPLSSPALLSYLQGRGINLELAKRECSEARYTHNGKRYFAIAFPNGSGGFEVRNPYFKGCIGHKDITLLAHTFNEWQNGCLVFEGFMDFLAYMTLVKQQDRWFVVESPCDYMILNSVANLKQALHYLDRYTHIHCFLDNDQAGRKTVESISNVFEYRVTDESFRYADYKDVNDYLMRKKRTASE